MNTIKLNYISNIVFYIEKSTNQKRTKVFLKNGTIIDTNFEEGIDICEELVKDRHITSVEDFKKIINNDFVHVSSEKELEENLDKYKPTKPFQEPTTSEDILEDFEEYKTDGKYGAEDHEFGVEESDLDSINELFSDEEEFEDDYEIPEQDLETDIDVDMGYDDDIPEDEEDDYKSIEEIFLDSKYIDKENVSESSDPEELDEVEEDLDNLDISSEYGEYNDYILPDNCDIEEPIQKKEKGIKGFFKRIVNKFKNNKLVKRIALSATAIAVALGIGVGSYSCASKKSLEGQIAKNNISNSDTKGKNSKQPHALFIGDNQYYDDYTFDQLQEVTENEVQKNSMEKVYNIISKFNVAFANKYYDKNSKIKPALSFSEVVAIQNAYNDYSKEEIGAIFNGIDASKKELSDNYKSASMQLMGAYIIETKNNLVDMSDSINSKEGKSFYKKYHDLFINAKSATGKKQLELVEEFYKNVRKDFPLTIKNRTEGISHADEYKIESYKLSVAPIIAAAEMLFQKLNVDYTLNKSEIHFFNDIGLCDIATEKFERIEIITLGRQTDSSNPLYDQYQEAIVEELQANNNYNIDDKSRELSKLEVFKLAVNGQVNKNMNDHNVSSQTAKSSTTSYSEKTTSKEYPIPQSEKNKIDNQIDKENAQAKKNGEKKAKTNLKRMQSNADKKAASVKESVKKDAKDMQNKINQANKKINNGGTVNEKDFKNHNVDFYDDYSDSKGNLDNSVDNITTDGRGDKTNEPLPDPNKTGASFDNKVNKKSQSSHTSSEINEKLVDEYISNLEKYPSSDEAYQYKR